MDMSDKTYIGIAYFEDDESGCCYVVKSTDLISIYKKMLDPVSLGMNEYIIGYIDTDMDNVIECILKSNSTPSEQFQKLSKFITIPEDVSICESFQINSGYPKWKKL